MASIKYTGTVPMSMSTAQTEQEESSLLPLSRIFNSPASKIMDFLLTNQDFDYSESDISKQTGVSARTIQRTLPYLVDENLVRRTRKSGKAFMYESNLDSSRTNALLDYIKSTRKEVLQQNF